MKNVAAIVLFLLFLCSCGPFFDSGNIYFAKESTISAVEEDITVALLDEVTAQSIAVPDSSPPIGIKKASDFTYTLKYVAKAEAVVVDGVTTQANDLTISGNNAFIAYNVAGPVFSGAIQIIDISNKRRPAVIVEIHFLHMDINAILFDNDILIFGGAADPDIWGFRSFIAKIFVSDPKIGEIETSLQALTSYALTDIAVHGGYYYASVGALDGGVHILDTGLNSVNFIPRGDVRGVDNYQDGVVALAGTYDTSENVAEILFISGQNLDGSVSIEDFGSPEAKATIVSRGSAFAFLGLSAAGMRVFDIGGVSFDTHLTPLAVHENPAVTIEGLIATTNSVSYHGNLLFSANGEWGVRVFDLPNLVELSSTNATELLGYFPLEGVEDAGQNYSANHIEYKSQYLLVAVGVGGVYFISLN